jgi:hypothetical protein
MKIIGSLLGISDILLVDFKMSKNCPTVNSLFLGDSMCIFHQGYEYATNTGMCFVFLFEKESLCADH